jgi:hypothetical protein
MTDLDNYIERFNLHVEEILIYENRHESKLKEPLILGEISNLPPPQYFTDEKVQMGHGGFHRNGTEQVIKELAKIGFIDFHEDPSLIFHMKRTIDELFVGITCYYSYQSDYKQMSRIETHNYVHAASVYECMKRKVRQLKTGMTKRYHEMDTRKIEILITALHCYEYWARDKGIEIRENFYKEEGRVEDATSKPTEPDNEPETEPNPEPSMAIEPPISTKQEDPTKLEPKYKALNPENTEILYKNKTYIVSRWAGEVIKILDKNPIEKPEGIYETYEIFQELEKIGCPPSYRKISEFFKHTIEAKKFFNGGKGLVNRISTGYWKLKK